MEQRPIQGRVEWFAGFDQFRCGLEAGERGFIGQAWPVVGRGRLGVEGADPVGTGFQQIGQFVQDRRVDGVPRFAEQPVQDDAPAPGVRGGIANAAGDRKAGPWHDPSRLERQFRQVDRYRIGTREIALAVVEGDPGAVALQPACDHGIGSPWQPDPDIGLCR